MNRANHFVPSSSSHKQKSYHAMTLVSREYTIRLKCFIKGFNHFARFDFVQSSKVRILDFPQTCINIFVEFTHSRAMALFTRAQCPSNFTICFTSDFILIICYQFPKQFGIFKYFRAIVDKALGWWFVGQLKSLDLTQPQSLLARMNRLMMEW